MRKIIKQIEVYFCGNGQCKANHEYLSQAIKCNKRQLRTMNLKIDVIEVALKFFGDVLPLHTYMRHAGFTDTTFYKYLTTVTKEMDKEYDWFRATKLTVKKIKADSVAWRRAAGIYLRKLKRDREDLMDWLDEVGEC